MDRIPYIVEFFAAKQKCSFETIRTKTQEGKKKPLLKRFLFMA